MILILKNQQAIHNGYNCQEYQGRINNDVASIATTSALAEMINIGEAMHCPKCHVRLSLYDKL